MTLLVRVGALLSLLVGLLAITGGVTFLVAASAWWIVILIYVGFFAGVALAVIWLGIFVAYVIVYGARVLGGDRT